MMTEKQSENIVKRKAGFNKLFKLEQIKNICHSDELK